MRIWIVRKHPPMPYRGQIGNLEAFTIHGTYVTRAEAANEANERNKRSRYLFTVAKVELREKNAQPSKPLTDEQQIAEALRRHSLTLVKTAAGYDVLKLEQITAHHIKGKA